MGYTLFISIEARHEELEAYQYYEGQLEGLGGEFLAELEKHYAKLEINPMAFSFMNNSNIVRDVYLGRFPFLIVYVVIGNQVNVVGEAYAKKTLFVIFVPCFTTRS